MKKRPVNIGIMGDFNPTRISQTATNNALDHAANDLHLKITVEWLPTETLLDTKSPEKLQKYSGLFAAPGSPYISMQGALKGIQFARESGKPFFGT
jgi:CTP synthase (UTP-ammonia lyase)